MAKESIKAVTLSILALLATGIVSSMATSPGGNLVRSAASIIIKERPVYSFGSHKPIVGKYDCSSFVKETALRANLAILPRDSRSQFELLHETGKVWLKGDPGWQNLRPGDLIFFSGTYRHRHSNPISHVMIYAGENQMIGAQSSGVGLFDFTPSPPKGSPGADCRSVYGKSTVYAYARPDWSKIQRRKAENSSTPASPRASQYQTVSGSGEYRYYAGSVSRQSLPAHRSSSGNTGWLPSR